MRRTKRGARMRTAIVNEIADVYIEERKNERTLSFGDGLDVMARAILNALDSERYSLLKVAERTALDVLIATLTQALETTSSFVQHKVETRGLYNKEIQR